MPDEYPRWWPSVHPETGSEIVGGTVQTDYNTKVHDWGPPQRHEWITDEDGEQGFREVPEEQYQAALAEWKRTGGKFVTRGPMVVTGKFQFKDGSACQGVLTNPEGISSVDAPRWSWLELAQVLPGR